MTNPPLPSAPVLPSALPLPSAPPPLPSAPVIATMPKSLEHNLTQASSTTATLFGCPTKNLPPKKYTQFKEKNRSGPYRTKTEAISAAGIGGTVRRSPKSDVYYAYTQNYVDCLKKRKNQ